MRADTATIEWYPLPNFSADYWGAIPFRITPFPDGTMWFTEIGQNPQGDLQIGRISTDGVITEYTVPFDLNALGAITAGPDGALWFTEGTQRGNYPNGNKIGRMTASGSVTEYVLPHKDGTFTLPGPSSITTGPDGAVWFSGPGGLGRIDTDGTITEFPAVPGGSSMTTGPDGAFWVCDSDSRFIVRVTTGGVVTARYELWLSSLLVGGGCTSISAGPDGALWYTVSLRYSTNGVVETTSFIGRITTDGVIAEYPLGEGQAYGITTGPDGALWFVLSGAGSYTIGRITTLGLYTLCSPIAGSAPYGLAAGPDGGLWFTTPPNEPTERGRIGRLTPTRRCHRQLSY